MNKLQQSFCQTVQTPLTDCTAILFRLRFKNADMSKANVNSAKGVNHLSKKTCDHMSHLLSSDQLRGTDGSNT